MASPGAHKAALLLMSLDPATAAELLKAARPEMVTEIVAELVSIKSSPAGRKGPDITTVNEFFGHLRKGATGTREGFLEALLEGAVGKSRSAEMLTQVRALIQSRDPFMNIRTRDINELAAALAGESGQVAALVLAELPAKKSTLLLELLDESVKTQALRGMAAGGEIPAETRQRIANLVENRLAALAKGNPADAAPVAASGALAQQRRDAQLRKVALLLRGLAIEPRTKLAKAISDQDPATAAAIQKMMVLWEDLPFVADRSMQEVLRTVDAKSLALSLVNADPSNAAKIRQNISERAAAMLDEESSLLKTPKPAEIDTARQKILDPLRALNAKGDLSFVET